MLIERNWTIFRDDDIGIPAHQIEPVTELLGVRYRCGKRGYLSALGKVDQNFFPYRTPKFIREVMNFIHNYILEILKSAGVRINHVTKNLSCHNNDLCLGINTCITGKQPNIRITEHLFKICKFLVG